LFSLSLSLTSSASRLASFPSFDRYQQTATQGHRNVSPKLKRVRA
jgi:hypothetical protein